ncbi:unnamed protein product [Scytosiphon promiscuus]
MRARKKTERAEMNQNNSVGMSGNDKAGIAATKMEFDLWTKKDVATVKTWARAEECRIPNKRVAKGGRLHKFMNILLNNCEYIGERLASEKRFQDASRDPTMPSGLELKRQFVAPLAKRVSALLALSLPSLLLYSSSSLLQGPVACSLVFSVVWIDLTSPLDLSENSG